MYNFFTKFISILLIGLFFAYPSSLFADDTQSKCNATVVNLSDPTSMSFYNFINKSNTPVDVWFSEAHCNSPGGGIAAVASYYNSSTNTITIRPGQTLVNALSQAPDHNAQSQTDAHDMQKQYTEYSKIGFGVMVFAHPSKTCTICANVKLTNPITGTIQYTTITSTLDCNDGFHHMTTLPATTGWTTTPPTGIAPNCQP